MATLNTSLSQHQKIDSPYNKVALFFDWKGKNINSVQDTHVESVALVFKRNHQYSVHVSIPETNDTDAIDKLSFSVKNFTDDTYKTCKKLKVNIEHVKSLVLKVIFSDRSFNRLKVKEIKLELSSELKIFQSYHIVFSSIDQKFKAQLIEGPSSENIAPKSIRKRNTEKKVDS